jgi:hypothetical protein
LASAFVASALASAFVVSAFALASAFLVGLGLRIGLCRQPWLSARAGSGFAAGFLSSAGLSILVVPELDVALDLVVGGVTDAVDVLHVLKLLEGPFFLR